ncbi:8-amino-7-oxononanoate synthase [Pantoea sp. 1.19]|uniref:8-amino-7-oxononanoate synthase n=1 Tax=Pantoea sp. 1.19 TaxID=1925589 RepID=UPI000948FB04|nr:8-amino-7-oxononanoate synthase [Pantoea sp. 1.19]
MSWHARIDAALAARRAEDSLRQRVVLDRPDARTLRAADGQWCNFAGNDYLGLSRHPQLISAWQEGAARYGVGSAASAHVTGYTPAQANLESALAEWLGYPRALLFISGFAANQATIAALLGPGDRLLADKLAHASLLEAGMHSPATLRRFHHNSPDSLARLLAAPTDGETLVVTEGLFSMDGDAAPLPLLSALSRQHRSWLLVDDAHGVGVLGEAGRGSCAQQGVRPDLLIVTFGKAFGLSGAAVLCSEAVAEYLLQFARHLIYSTAMPPAQAVALQAALRCVQQGDALRARLQHNIDWFRQQAAARGLPLTASASAIQPLIVGDNARTLRLAGHLRRRGYWVGAIRPPTVPPGTARLRITLSAAHREADINGLLEALSDAGE